MTLENFEKLVFEKYRDDKDFAEFLIENGFDQKSSFFQFMSLYSDEMLGSEGHISVASVSPSVSFK